MAAAPVVDGNDNGADGKARNVVVKSETMDVVDGECGVPQPMVPAYGDPMVTFGSLGDTVLDEHGESTECSSSFGASCSESDDDMEPDTGGMEVDSLFHPHIGVDDTTDVPHSVRRKKVTSEWRKFIGPEMRRCQWLELRMKDLLSQVAKYDRELALINHEKDLQLEMIKAISPKSELHQIDLQSHERNTMKRRKRKRHEDIMDTAMYTEKHQILSYYYEKQKKKAETDAEKQKKGAETDELLDNDDDDDSNSLVVEDTKKSLCLNDSLFGSKENDIVIEQYSLREILLSIDGIQSRIIRLQNHLSDACNKVDHSQKTRKVQKKKAMNSFLQKDSGALPSDCTLKYVKNNTVKPSLVDDITQSDADGITLGMLFGLDNSLIDADIGGLCKESADDVLIDNQAARQEGYWQFEKVNQTLATHSGLIKNVGETSSSKELKTSEQVGHNVGEISSYKEEKTSEQVGHNVGQISSSKEEKSSEQVGHAVLPRTTPIVKLVKKRGPKPKKKRDRSLPHTEDKIKKNHVMYGKKKNMEEGFSNPNTEKVLLVAVDTRRSQRVRKQKMY
ncbi:hypothetical protein ACP70R_028420 [Stipagrostis hirtigluma subsp. patula]